MDDPKQLINRFVEELWNERRLDVAEAIFAKDCVTHQLRSGVPADAVPRGPQTIKEHVTSWITSFPDLHFSVEQMLSEGDRVVMQLLMEGTHQRAWLGIPASGKKMQIRMFTVHRVVQGKIVEDWVLVESLGVFQQLGVVPNTADLVGNFLRQQSDC
jgi:Predicted ester cyclase